MRAALVVMARKYSGAGAVAEHCARALHRVGVEARLLFPRGRNLENRLAGVGWADADLVKERHPGDLARNFAAVRRFTDAADVVVCHLPHDHLLCVAAGVHRRKPLVRAFRNSSHLHRDPWHRALSHRLSGTLLAHSGMARRLERCVPGVPHAAIPVPLEDRFQPGGDGATWRRGLGIPVGAPVLGSVGKLAARRGFETVLEVAARLDPDLHVIIVGHGELQPRLERLAARLGVAERVRWTGYVEEELHDLYAAMDVVIYTAAGSDHGHRMISEAQGCARPVVAARLPGVAGLIDDGRTGRITAPDPTSLASAVSELLADRAAADAMARTAASAVEARRFAPVGARLQSFLAEVVARAGEGTTTSTL